MFAGGTGILASLARRLRLTGWCAVHDRQWGNDITRSGICRTRRTAESGTPIDASGSFPDGSRFADVDGLEAALLRRPELFAGAFTEKLLTYASGRGVEYYDAPAVRAIVRQARSRDFRISSIILGVVHSQPFQMRTSR